MDTHAQVTFMTKKKRKKKQKIEKKMFFELFNVVFLCLFKK